MEKLAICLVVLPFVASAACAEPVEAPQAAVITGMSEAEDIAAIRA